MPRVAPRAPTAAPIERNTRSRSRKNTVASDKGICLAKPFDGVNCGDHRAKTCFKCSKGRNGADRCNGDCKWHRYNFCADKDEKTDVSCGDHRAKTCNKCT